MITHKHKFVSARFCDNDRKIVSVLWSDHINADEIYEDIIEARDSDESWQHLLNFTTIDEIHETTIAHNKQERKDFIHAIKKIAEKENLVYSESSDGMFKKFNSILFDDNIESEILFKAKLAAFEIQFVKDCKNRTLKSKLRKAKTIAETYSILFEIQAYMSEQADSDKEASE